MNGLFETAKDSAEQTQEEINQIMSDWKENIISSEEAVFNLNELYKKKQFQLKMTEDDLKDPKTKISDEDLIIWASIGATINANKELILKNKQ